jgi:hypothetical protein
MPRAATTSDAFNAVGERPVHDVVESLGLVQPQVSRHLRVLESGRSKG